MRTDIVNLPAGTVTQGAGEDFRFLTMNGHTVPVDYQNPQWGTQGWHQHIPEFSQQRWTELNETAKATFATNAQITVDNFLRISN